jgi:ferritin-like metal-binding protein YciE
MGLTSPEIESPYELFVHKLGAALTMEQTTLEMLGKLQAEASDSTLKRQLQQHHKETQQQIENLHRAFEAIGEEPEPKPCPAIEGLQKEGEQLLSQVDEELVDAVILSSVIETEHHEVAVYDGLIIQAEVMGEDDLVALFQENLEQEDQALDKAIKGAEQQASRFAEQTA